MVDLVDLSLPGPVIIYGSPSLTETVVAAGVNPARLIFITPDSEVCKNQKGMYPASTVVVANFFHLRSEAAKLVPEPVAAILSRFSTSGLTDDALRIFVMNALSILHPRGAFVQSEGIGLSFTPSKSFPEDLITQAEVHAPARPQDVPSYAPGIFATDPRIFVFRGPANQIQKFDILRKDTVELDGALKSEGPIERKRFHKKFNKATEASVSGATLPDNLEPWLFDFRGKPRSERDKTLLAFLTRVYGPFMKEHRAVLREYIYSKHPRLYRALVGFGFENLPKRLQMPSRPEKVQKRIHKAAKGAYRSLNPAEKRSVRGHTRRVEQASLKK